MCDHLFSIVIYYETCSIICAHCSQNLTREDVVERTKKIIKFHGKHGKGGGLTKGGVWDYWISLNPEDKDIIK